MSPTMSLLLAGFVRHFLENTFHLNFSPQNVSFYLKITNCPIAVEDHKMSHSSCKSPSILSTRKYEASLRLELIEGMKMCLNKIFYYTSGLDGVWIKINKVWINPNKSHYSLDQSKLRKC